MFKYKKNNYPSRTFVIKRKGWKHTETITISVASLESEMIKNRPSLGSGTEQKIDEQIYFYVDDDKITLSAEEICNSHVDEPVKFIEEIFDEE